MPPRWTREDAALRWCRPQAAVMERGRFTPLHSAAPLPRPVGYRGSGTLVAEELSSTAFVAETLLPTKTGEYRLRGYRHTVSRGLWGVGMGCSMGA